MEQYCSGYTNLYSTNCGRFIFLHTLPEFIVHKIFDAISCKELTLEKTLMLGGIGGRRKRGPQKMRWLESITYLIEVSLSELREMVMDREAWRAPIHGVAKNRT